MAIFIPLILYQTWDSSKLKDFADDNFNFCEIAENSPKREKTLWEEEKLLEI